LPRSTKPQDRTKKKPRPEKAAVTARSARDDSKETAEKSSEHVDAKASHSVDAKASHPANAKASHSVDAKASSSNEETEPSEGDDAASEGDGDDAPIEGEAYPDVADDGAVPLQQGKAREASESSSIERFDPLSAYLREVQRHRLLSPEETQALAEKFVKTQDSASAARLVTANLRLVVKIAYEYRRAYKNIMDLIQEGNIGLMQAVKRYDPYRGVKLSSYAAWWIRAYILRFILNNWRLVKLGTTQAQR
jgi:RNA polymerase sigma-32 factor